MKNQNFSYSFQSSKTPAAIFDLLLHVDQWWSGIFGETITGKSQNVDDEFSFYAGEGMHFSKQKMIELVPDKRVAWRVSDSKLTFLSDTAEWTGTRFYFDISEEGGKTKVTFTHEGLLPSLECYNSCSGGWTKYLNALKEKIS
jgi:hypothetical protein